MPRIAIVHEWFTKWAGSEAVLEQMLNCFPNADLYAITSQPDVEGQNHLGERKIHTSFIQRLPCASRWPQLYLPILPWAVESLDLRGYDIIISNSHCVAKGVITSPDCRHIAYVHSPARYAWDLQHEYTKRVPWIMRPLWSWQMHRLRAWDMISSTRPNVISCNSHYIARRIERAWNRSATVIYPPVDVSAFTLGGQRDDYYLTASRMVGYKKIPLIAEAFAQMPNRKLRIIGDGADMARVRKIAESVSNIEVFGHVNRDTLIKNMQQARAFVFSAEEDFGITPVEAMACGTPVIAYNKGGAAESVKDGITGIFFPEQTTVAIKAAIEHFERLPTFDPMACRSQAEKFTPEHFRQKFTAFVEK